MLPCPPFADPARWELAERIRLLQLEKEDLQTERDALRAENERLRAYIEALGGDLVTYDALAAVDRERPE